MTVAGTVLGAYGYTAPEQVHDAHAADHRSDIYALGWTLYHCLTGELPLVAKRRSRPRGEGGGRVADRRQGPVPDVPDAVAETLDAMLAESPDTACKAWRPRCMFGAVRGICAGPGGQRWPAEFLIWMRNPESSVFSRRGVSSFAAWLANDWERSSGY